MKKLIYILFLALALCFTPRKIQAQESDLFDLSLAELMDMEITSASKFGESIKETPATILVITKEDIENRGYISLNEVIADLPGFDISSPFSDLTQQQYARGNRTGSFNERTLFMVNGIEHNILYCQAMNIAEDFPLSSIERIEILYGPASAVYGANAFSGIVNVITKSANEENNDNVYLYSGLGTNNTYFADMTYLGKQGDIDVSVSFRQFRSDRFDITESPGYFADETSDIKKWSGAPIPVGNGALIGNRALWGPYADIYPEYQNLADDHGLLTKLKYKNIELGFNNLITIHGNGSEYPYDKTMPTTHWKFLRNNGFIRINKYMNNKLNISTLVNYNSDGSSPESIWGEGWNASGNWNSLRTAEILSWKYQSQKMYIFEDFIYKPSEIITINGGFKYARGTFQRSYEFGFSDQLNFDPNRIDNVIDTINGIPYTVNDSLSSSDLHPPLPSSGILPGNTFSDNEYGGFLQMKFSLLENKLFVVGGARYDDNDIYGESFNPRIGAIFNVTEEISFKGNYGTAFQAPAPRNMYGGWGGLTISENLDPEEIMSVDIGTIYTSGNFSVDITGFYNTVTNSVLQGANMPDKIITGSEIKLNYLMKDLGPVLNKLKAHFNISLIDARFDSTFTSVYDTTRTSDLVGDIAPMKFNLILDADLVEHVHLNFRVNYVGEKETVISNPVEKVDGYMLLNTSIQLRNLFNSKLVMFANINNILDEKYYHPGWDAASAGEDLTKPSGGWYSSRLPQPGRTMMFGIRTSF